MKFNRSPWVWAGAAVLIALALLRMVRSMENGKTALIVSGIIIGLAIVGGLWWWQSSSRKRQVLDLRSLHPGDYTLPVRSTTANVAPVREAAARLGQRAKGALDVNAMSANTEALTLWHGRGKEVMSVPSRRITALLIDEVNDGIHRYPNLIALVDETIKVPFSPSLQDGESLEGSAHRLANALGLATERIVTQS